jgi:fibronectin type 3 domain-containing protein
MLSAHTPHTQDCGSRVGGCFGALLLMTIATLMVACSRGGAELVVPKAVVPIVPAPNTATLTWDPPAVATNVAGYRVYYGTATGTYFQLPGNGVDAGTANTYTVTNLLSGTTYYFIVTAHDVSNNESGASNEVSKSIP